MIAYPVVPNPVTASGIVFSATGGDFGMTNVVVSGPNRVSYSPPSTDTSRATSPLYLSFGVANGTRDAQGVIHYQPDLSRFQLYVVSPANKVLIQGQPSPNSWKVTPIGGTRYACTGNLLFSPPLSAAVGAITVTFDTALPPGKQVISGQLYYVSTL